MTRELNQWSKRDLTPLGRITVIKTLIISKIIHFLIALPSPSDKLLKQINSMFFSFIWNGQPDKIKRNVSALNVINGGLGMVDIRAFDQSLKLAWVRKLTNSQSKWKTLIELVYPDLSQIYKLGNAFVYKIKNNIKNRFWHDVTSALFSFTEKFYSEPKNNTKWCSFLYNEKIKIGQSTIKNKSLIDKDICYIYQLMEGGIFLTHQNFKNKFNINIDFLQYNSLISAIKKYLSNFQSSSSITVDFQPHIDLIIKSAKEKSNLRQYILEKDVITGQQKWHNNIGISEDYWLKSFHILKNTTSDTKLHWFQMRILHNILTTNRSVSKYMTNQTDMCEFCGSHSETIQHLMWHCTKVQSFWKELLTILQTRCTNIKNIQLNETLVLFGHSNNTTYDNIFLLIILMAKFYIYRSKVQKTTLKTRIFVQEIYNRYKVEMHINNNNKKFENAWAPYQLIFKSLM